MNKLPRRNDILNRFICYRPKKSATSTSTSDAITPEPVIQATIMTPEPVIPAPIITPLAKVIVKRTPKIRVFFDLDSTLFISKSALRFIDNESKRKKLLEHFPHLTRVASQHGDTYFIFLEETKKLFHWLIKNNVRIGFATLALYSKQYVLPLLNKHYDLPAEALAKSIYLNAINLKRNNTSKCEQLSKMACKSGKEQDIIFLVDDSIKQFKRYTANKPEIYGVHAQGFLPRLEPLEASNCTPESVITDFAYLEEIRTKVQKCLDNIRNEALLESTGSSPLALDDSAPSKTKCVVNI